MSPSYYTYYVSTKSLVKYLNINECPKINSNKTKLSSRKMDPPAKKSWFIQSRTELLFWTYLLYNKTCNLSVYISVYTKRKTKPLPNLHLNLNSFRIKGVLTIYRNAHIWVIFRMEKGQNVAITCERSLRSAQTLTSKRQVRRKI